MERSEYTFSCDRCGGSVARLRALRAGEGDGHLVSRERLVRELWLATLERPMPMAQALSLVQRAREEPAALAAAEPDLCGFFCRRCGKPYCERCWSHEAPEWDDGFYDCTHGSCPEGHRQVIDD